MCAQLQDRVVPVATRGTMSQARSAARRAVLAIDSQGEARRRAAARRVRDAFVVNEEDGLALFAVRLAAEHAHACLAVVDALAHDNRFVGQGDVTVGERRARAAVALILDAGRSAVGLPEPQLRAHLDVTIDLDTLLDLQRPGAGAAQIAGVGPVGADVVRDLIADPDVTLTMRRLVTDPLTGHLLDLGRTRYEVTGRLREFLTVRDRTCRFPGCGRRAARCQLDHAEAWADGGATNPSNLGALCLRHHQMKTHGGWAIASARADGSCSWTSPYGHEYERRPEPVGIPSARSPDPDPGDPPPG